MKVKAIQKRRWPLTHKGFKSLFGLADYYHHFIQDFSKVARTLPDFWKKNCYPKSGTSFVTKSLESLRASCLRRLCLSSWNLTNLLRCIRGRVILHWRSVDASWMAISYVSMKFNGYNTSLKNVATVVGVGQDQGVSGQ